MEEFFFNTHTYSDKYSINDWNVLTNKLFRKFFSDDQSFDNNIDILRAELVNYCNISQSQSYIELFENTINYYQELKSKSIIIFNEVFVNHMPDLIKTDFNWTGLATTQTNQSNFSERDKITYKFQAIENILEGCFKNRFKLLYHVEKSIENSVYSNDADFGTYISQFKNRSNQFDLYLKDPIFNISINQWRNISAHKTFDVNLSNIIIRYGKPLLKEVEITYNDFDNIFKWVQLSYSSLRLSQVINILSSTSISNAIDANKVTLRYESLLLILIHNLQIVGFPFVAIKQVNNEINICLKAKLNADLKESIIHASQCLSQLSSIIYSDKFVKDKFKLAKFTILSKQNNVLATAQTDINSMCQMLIEYKEHDENDFNKEMLRLIEFKFYNQNL